MLTGYSSGMNWSPLNWRMNLKTKNLKKSLRNPKMNSKNPTTKMMNLMKTMTKRAAMRRMNSKNPTTKKTVEKTKRMNLKIMTNCWKTKKIPSPAKKKSLRNLRMRNWMTAAMSLNLSLMKRKQTKNCWPRIVPVHRYIYCQKSPQHLASEAALRYWILSCRLLFQEHPVDLA